MHWPMQLAFRIAPGPMTRSSGFRQRSVAATERRNKKKAERGYGPLATGRSSGYQPSHGSSSGGTQQQDSQWDSWDSWNWQSWSSGDAPQWDWGSWNWGTWGWWS